MMSENNLTSFLKVTSLYDLYSSQCIIIYKFLCHAGHCLRAKIMQNVGDIVS